MASISCPHCGKSLHADPDHAGKTAACKQCGGQFTIPGIPPLANQLLPPAPPPLPMTTGYSQQHPPMVFVQTSQPRERRLEAGGWFSRSFAASSGVFLAYLIFFVAIPAILVFAVCGGCLVFTGNVANEIAKESTKDNEAGVAQAKTVLRRFKIRGDVSSDSICSTFTLEPDITHSVSGSINTPEGVKPYKADFYVATFGDKRKWTLKRLTVDAETLHDATEQAKRELEMERINADYQRTMNELLAR